jgi:hypothetical protein
VQNFIAIPPHGGVRNVGNFCRLNSYCEGLHALAGVDGRSISAPVEGLNMKRQTTALIPLLITLGVLNPQSALAEDDSGSQFVTINKILRGEGRPGDTASAKNGEVVYTVLDGGIVELKNLRYGTVQRFSPVSQNDNIRTK